MYTISFQTTISWLLILFLVSCNEKDEVFRTTELTSVEGINGDIDWKLEYDNCNLVSIEFRALPGALLTPRIYLNPIDFQPIGSRMEFGYTNDVLSSIRAVDSSQGSVRERFFLVEVIDGLVTRLSPSQTLIDNMPASGSLVGITFYYDSDSRIDSMSLTNGNSIAYFYNSSGDIEKANYRIVTSNSLTTEFYSFSNNFSNPFAKLPFRYLLSYAAYWSPRPISVASFDLRLYDYRAEGGLLIEAEETTYGDSMYISKFVYQEFDCQ